MKNHLSLQTILPWIMIAVLTSVVAMVFGVSRDDSLITLLSASGFSLFIVGMGLATNLPYWRQSGSFDEQQGARVATPSGPATAVEHAAEYAEAAEEDAVSIARKNAKLFATSYIWGGMAMLAVYTLTQLRWQHGWQYALGMFVLAAVTIVFAVILNQPSSKTRAKAMAFASFLTKVQGAAALAGLVFLVGTGKLASTRADWAANYVFLFGGIAIAVLSGIALRSHRVLKA